MKNTYTYTARSAENPDHVATFTLHDQELSIQLGGVLQTEIDKLFQSAENDGEAPLPAWLKPLLTWFFQQALRPFQLADVDAQTEGNHLRVSAWLRAGGLRLFPLTLAWDQVDNPNAARDFVQELKRRKAAAQPASRLPGPLDYWASWVLLGVLLLVLPLRWFRPE